MMKSSKQKMAALMLVVATPGSLMFSCSGTFTRDLRDAASAGALDFVTQTTFDALSAWIAIPADAADGVDEG